MMPTVTVPPLPLPLALRNTALSVTGLATGGKPDAFEVFRAKCDSQVEQLRAELAAYPPDVVEDAAYAQCALLDEIALVSLKGEDRTHWEHEPLQVRLFQSHNAGQELIARIERRLAEPQPIRPLLAIFAAVLSLGFRGKFVLDDDTKRTALMQALDQRLLDQRDTTGGVLVTPAGAAHWFERLAPWGWPLLAAAASVLFYLGLRQWFTASIAHIAA